MKNARVYSVMLPYFKQGDDLSHCMSETKSDAEALRAHAEQLRLAAEILDKLAVCAVDKELEIDCADTHCIMVTASDKVAKQLVAENILYEEEFEEDEEEFGEDEEVEEYDN